MAIVHLIEMFLELAHAIHGISELFRRRSERDRILSAQPPLDRSGSTPSS